MHDTWLPRDLPVLAAIVTAFDQPERYHLPIQELTGICELPEEDVQAAVRALAESNPPYIRSTGAAQLTYPVIISGVTERARRTVGQWPSAESLVTQLAEGLSAAAEHEIDPKKRRGFREAAKIIGGTGRDIVTEIMAKIIMSKTRMG